MGSPPMAQSQRSSKTGKSGAMVYGIVLYDFQAERADELEAKAGEAIIVIAQSNPEWFVAKPIGRLGGPGLIPVTFVEIRDMATNTAVPNPHEAVKKAGIPKVEEWKKMAAEYKNSSITLGKFEAGGPPSQGLEQGMDRLSLQQQQGQPQQQFAQPHQQQPPLMSPQNGAYVRTLHFSPLFLTVVIPTRLLFLVTRDANQTVTFPAPATNGLSRISTANKQHATSWRLP